jgi:hypothetical protein
LEVSGERAVAIGSLLGKEALFNVEHVAKVCNA